MSRPLSPTDLLPYPNDTERRSHFLLRWVRATKVKRMFPHGTAMQAGMEAWEAARMSSVVSVKTEEDQFLVF